MELESQNHSRNGLLGPDSIMVVYMDPLGISTTTRRAQIAGCLLTSVLSASSDGSTTSDASRAGLDWHGSRGA